jgi:hypothetical protein
MANSAFLVLLTTDYSEVLLKVISAGTLLIMQAFFPKSILVTFSWENGPTDYLYMCHHRENVD